jgi:hypothetical protein
MKFCDRVRRRQFLNLRRKRDARVVNDLEKIYTRVLNVRAARRQRAENHHCKKLPTLHGSISRRRRKNYKQLFAPRDKVAPLIYETA